MSPLSVMATSKYGSVRVNGMNLEKDRFKPPGADKLIGTLKVNSNNSAVNVTYKPAGK